MVCVSVAWIDGNSAAGVRYRLVIFADVAVSIPSDAVGASVKRGHANDLGGIRDRSVKLAFSDVGRCAVDKSAQEIRVNGDRTIIICVRFVAFSCAIVDKPPIGICESVVWVNDDSLVEILECFAIIAVGVAIQSSKVGVWDREVRINGDGAVVIGYRLVRLALFVVGKSPVVVGLSVIRV